jgi:amino acid adenylation domain-containing protein
MLDSDNGTTKFDLTLSMQETEEELVGEVEYNTDLFDAATIERMVGHFQTLLAGIVAHPDQRLLDLPLLTDVEQRQLREWRSGSGGWLPVSGEGGESQALTPEACLHELFEAQVERTPEAIAVVFEDESLTYKELNRRANQLARYLQALGVAPEVLVGLYVERSLDMVVGMLGILKAGGAYLPLDVAYPQERLAFMLQDAGVSVLLTQQHLEAGYQSSAPAPQSLRVICLDREWSAIAQENSENLCRSATADNLAYVIYTSGSTGKPKGVLVSHSNVVRLFEATQPWYHFDENDIWTLFHTYAFDFSVWELWGALLYGGRLVVVPYLVSRSPEAFYELLSKAAVTVLNQTPSAFRQLIWAEHASTTTPKLSLRLVIFGGEALDLASLEPWFDRHGDQSPRLVNMYGITETTVHVTYRPLAAADLRTARGSMIGSAIPDLHLSILDQRLRPVPIGVPGEMYVGGPGLARGYLNHPALTAERFVPDPFSSSALRLYKTGDLARYLPDGDIEYLGRIDHQVKIRGFRIELGEIQATLSQHPTVQEAVVLAREDTPGERYLVAYVVPNQEQALSTHDLRRFLQEKLPDYMAPAVFMPLDAMPLTPNGKVDRKALPIPDQGRPDTGVTYIAPRTPAEEAMAKIWAELLHVETVGIHDDYFDLGGHSLLGTQLISRIRDTFQVELPLRTLFEEPTVAGLVQSIEAARWAAQDLAAAPGVPVSDYEEGEV